MRIITKLAIAALAAGCVSTPRLFPAEIHLPLGYLLFNPEKYAVGQQIAVFGHLYDGRLYLSKESAVARDIVSSFLVSSPYDDRFFNESECDGKFVRVFASLEMRPGEYFIGDVRRIEIAPTEYPRKRPAQTWVILPTVCFDRDPRPAA